MRFRPALVALAVVVSVLTLGGCTGSADWQPSFVPVDSGTSVFVDVYSDMANFDLKLHVPRMSWTPDGSALRVAGAAVTLSPQQSALWSVNPTTHAVSTVLTMPGGYLFSAVDCYPGATFCDLVYTSGRVLRRAANGDTATILTSTANGFFVSENGRFFVYAESEGAMRLLDATTGVKQTLNIPDITKFREIAAVANDGAEVDVVAASGTSVTRYRLADGTSTTWAVPVGDPTWSRSVHQLQWVGSTLYALVRYFSETHVRFIQYPVDGGPSVTLGTTGKGVGLGLFSWRPQAQRMVLEVVSASETEPDPVTRPAVSVRQFELELLRGGVSTRIARSQFGWLNMVLSPDGRTMAYGSGRVALKSLPE